MAIKLNTAYSKKLGLPGFSSHAFSASVEVELGDINQVKCRIRPFAFQRNMQADYGLFQYLIESHQALLSGVR